MRVVVGGGQPRSSPHAGKGVGGVGLADADEIHLWAHRIRHDADDERPQVVVEQHLHAVRLERDGRLRAVRRVLGDLADRGAAEAPDLPEVILGLDRHEELSEDLTGQLGREPQPRHLGVHLEVLQIHALGDAHVPTEAVEDDDDLPVGEESEDRRRVEQVGDAVVGQECRHAFVTLHCVYPPL